jgi:cobalt-zinc-cadmium efflux system membrane fusion protein
MKHPTRRCLVACSLIAAGMALPAGGCKRMVQDTIAHADPEGHDHEAAGDREHGGPGQHVDEVTLSAPAIEQYGVRVEAAQLWRLRPTFIAPARVGFNTELSAHVGSPLPGRVVDMKVRQGSDVQPGDPLLVIESAELGAAQSDYLIKRTAAETAGPTVDLARAVWDRSRNLYESSQAIALSDVQRREAEHKAAIAAQKSAQAEAQAAENRLHLLGMTQDQVEELTASGEVNPRFTIVAPLGGQVVQREVTLGELVSPDRPALLVITDMTKLWVLADVPEARLREVAPGTRAWVRIGGVQGAQCDGVVTFIAPIVDATTRTAQVRIEVQDGAIPLKPGMFAQVEIVATGTAGEEPPPVVAVPEGAIQLVEGGTSVFVPVPGEENTFTRRSVSVGRNIGGLVAVHSGLVEGEQLVVAGSFILKAELGKSTAEHAH